MDLRQQRTSDETKGSNGKGKVPICFRTGKRGFLYRNLKRSNSRAMKKGRTLFRGRCSSGGFEEARDREKSHQTDDKEVGAGDRLT